MSTATESTEKNLHITVITPARSVLDTHAQALVAPAFDGEVGVLPGHAPMLALLGVGELRLTTADGQNKRMAIRGGFLQVNKNQVTVLTPESASKEELKADTLQAEAQKIDSENPTKLDERDALEARRTWLRARQKVQGGSSSGGAHSASH